MSAQRTPESEADFLNAVASGRHRKGASSRIRQIVAKKERDLYGVLACFCCGKPVSVSGSTLEHIEPQAKGGKTVLGNLALSHAPCNTKRGDSGSPRAAIAKATRIDREMLPHVDYSRVGCRTDLPVDFAGPEPREFDTDEPLMTLTELFVIVLIVGACFGLALKFYMP